MRRSYELPGAPGPVDGLDPGASRRLGDAVRRGVRAAALAHADGHRLAGDPGMATRGPSGPVREAFGGGRADEVPSYDHQAQRVAIPVVPSPSPPGPHGPPPGTPGGGAGGTPGGEPWVGQISATWNAALRRHPFKDPEHPYDNIISDLPHGTRVTVSGQEHGWLQVQVGSGDAARSGYVSHELVSYAGPVQPASPGPLIVLADPTSSALTALHRAERRLQSVPDWVPTPQERQELNVWANIVEMNPQYTVDRQTFHVGFIPVGPIEVSTIEDFILFVETVEAQYPQADATQIAGEIRQLWYAGPNFERLLNSPGIVDQGTAIDIENPRNPIAQLFDLKSLKTRAHNLSTRFGTVDIAHTMAGIDAVMNGRARPPDQPDPAWTALNAAIGDDPRDVATWAGDLGQAYAEFLVRRYHERSSGATLESYVRDKASAAQLLGDIHGYIAAEVWRQTPPTSLADFSTRVSDILRTMYLDPGAGPVGSAPTYRKRVEQVSGVSGDDLRALVRRRVLAVARVWYVNAVYKLGYGELVGYGGSYLVGGESGVIDALMEEFDKFHEFNLHNAFSTDQIDGYIDHFMLMLDEQGI
jgi:hypothetical protein